MLPYEKREVTEAKQFSAKYLEANLDKDSE
jgi:hypothetical protein